MITQPSEAAEVVERQEQIARLETYVSSLRDEIDLRRSQFEEKKTQLLQQCRKTEQASREREQQTRSLNDEYFAQRRYHDNEIRRLQEEKTLLKLKEASLVKQLESTEQDKFLENAVTKDLAEKRAKEYAAQFKSKAIRKEETLEVVREQYNKVKDMYSEKTKLLEEDLLLLRREVDRLKATKDKEIADVKSILLSAKREMKMLFREAEARKNPGQASKANHVAELESQSEDDTVEVKDIQQLMKRMERMNKKLDPETVHA